MAQKLPILLFLLTAILQVKAQTTDSADFRWGNGYYYNLYVGDSITFLGKNIHLLKVENHYNLLKVGDDTVSLKVARRSLPDVVGGLRIFVADNTAVKSLTADKQVHGLLKKDALVCLSLAEVPLLNPDQYTFPVSFNDGFVWNAEEESYPFSLYKPEESIDSYISYPGFGIDLRDARGNQKHWLVAMEDSRVVWIEPKGENQVCVLLKSESQPEIYYLYNHLYLNNLKVKKGQKLVKGEIIGTAWGDQSWGHVHFAVIHSLNEPAMGECFSDVVNGFPQLFGLYFKNGYAHTRTFSRGRIAFGRPRSISGNQLNTGEFEYYAGKGWVTGKWNPAAKVEWVVSGNEGNARLKKILFEGVPAQVENPEDYFEYLIHVERGHYRIRAKTGDMFLPSWQVVEFEGVAASVKELGAGEFEWTGERIVNVGDGMLNIRIYLNEQSKKVAGISEIVFQKIF